MRNEKGQAAFEVVVGLMAITFVVLLVMTVFGWPFGKTPQDRRCVSYGGGPFEGAEYQSTHEPGSGIFIKGFFDDLFCYPVTERTYIITSRPGEGDTHYADAIAAPSQDNINVAFELALYFELNQEKLEEFHARIGKKTDAFTDEGWLQMLNEYVRPQIDQAVQRQSRGFDAVQMHGDQGVFREIQANLITELPFAINDALGDDYFSDYRVVLRRITLPEGLVAELQRNEASKIAIETKQNEILQREAEAEAIAKLNEALEQSGPAYVYLKCIEDEQCQIPSVAPFLSNVSFGR